MAGDFCRSLASGRKLRKYCEGQAVPFSPGGSPLYKPYRYVSPQRVGFSGLFGLKTDIDFAHFGPESGMIFEGTTGAYERSSYRFNPK